MNALIIKKKKMNPLVVPETSVKFKSAPCICTEQWIFYENFSVSVYVVRLKIFEWTKSFRRHLHQILGNWAGRNFVTE